MTDSAVQQPNQIPPQNVTPAPLPESVHVMVRNRTTVLFEDDVKAVTSHNETGTFDVLPEHSNFISVIKKNIILHKKDGQKYEIVIQNGIIKVKDSSVRCYIDLIAAK